MSPSRSLALPRWTSAEHTVRIGLPSRLPGAARVLATALWTPHERVSSLDVAPDLVPEIGSRRLAEPAPHSSSFGQQAPSWQGWSLRSSASLTCPASGIVHWQSRTHF